jgi:uncharacterized protein YukE
VTLRVSLEDMVGSAVHVTGQGEDLATAHVIADSKMDVAQPGWQGASAASLAAKLTDWQVTSKALLSRVADHAQGLHSAALAISSFEQAGAQALEQVGVAADGVTER